MNEAKFTIFIDGGCPFFRREVDFLQPKNQKGHLEFIDINISDLSFELEYGIIYKQAMDRIHALKNDGSVIKDIKIFQEAYNLIGLGWINASTKLPFFDNLSQFIYGLWAKYRLRINSRHSIEKLSSIRVLEMN